MEIFPNGGVRPEYMKDVLNRGNYPIKKGFKGKPDLVKKEIVEHLKAKIQHFSADGDQ